MRNRLLAWGTMTSAIVSFVKVGLQLLFVSLMARLVGPADYGLFALVAPVVTFVLLIAEGGFGISLARESEDNEEVWSTATYFLLGLGVVLGLLLVVWSFIQAPLINQPQLRPMMLALSITPVLLAVTVPAAARLTRQGRLGISSIVDLIAVLFGMAAAVAFALSGGGAWSLVTQPLVYWSIKAVLINVASPSFPKPRFITKHLQPHFRIGALILSGKFLDTGGRTIETSLISRFMGNEVLGAITFAGQMPRFLTESLGNSLWGLLYAYALHNNDAAGLIRTYRLTLRLFALTVLPCVILISVMVKPLINELLGPRWDTAIFMLKILLVSHAMNSLGGIGSSILYARGLAHIPFRISVESVTLRVVVVAIGCWAGMEWMACGLGAVDVYLGARGIGSLSKVMDRPFRIAMSAVAMPCLLGGLSGLFCWQLARLDFAGAWLPAFAATALYMAISFVVFCCLLALFERRRLVEDFTTIYRLLRKQ